jgi:hypothetical protein|tara:strand:+ start:569 stop:1234 length:666 start_codon:yes stop_codon:yes gene_type:complete
MDLSKYYNSSWYDFAIRTVKELKLTGKGDIIFDVGAGNSVLKSKINELNSKWVGFDYKPRNKGINEWNLDNSIPKNIDVNPDCILLLEVLEHLLNPGMALNNIRKASKSGTYLIISTPNPYWSVIRIKFFFKGVFPMFTNEDMDNNHHVFVVWPHVLYKLLKNNDFEILDSYTIGVKSKFPEFQVHPVLIVKILLFGIRRLIEFFDKKSKGMSYTVIAKKN